MRIFIISQSDVMRTRVENANNEHLSVCDFPYYLFNETHIWLSSDHQLALFKSNH